MLLLLRNKKMNECDVETSNMAAIRERDHAIGLD